MYATANAPPRTDMPIDELTHLDRDKVDTVITWLCEPR